MICIILKKTVFRSKLVIILISLQAFASSYLISEQMAPHDYFKSGYKISLWLLILIGILSILAITQIMKLIKFAEIESEAQISAIRLQESQEILKTLRAHRHDFLNHIQVIVGLIQLGKPVKAYDYANDVVKELSDEKSTDYTGEPELNALVLKMKALAEEKSIKLDFFYNKDLLLGIPVPPTKVARIVGNLLRNAIEAVENLAPEHRWVKFSVDCQKDSWILKVHNPGPEITKDDLSTVFETGFSTKCQNGRGLGLSIVKKIIDDYSGNIHLESNSDLGTIFTVCIPKID
ncbi:MAG: ATP-binding protein [Carboxydocellales bacterium]